MKAILKDGRVLDVVLGKGWGVVCTDGATEYIYTLGIEIDKIVPDKIEKGSLLNADIDWRQVEIQAAIGAMQVILTSRINYDKPSEIAYQAANYASALVRELKERELKKGGNV